MSKYNPLWEYVEKNNKDVMAMSFAEIESLLGFPIDHSFLTYKKELSEYGFSVNKLSVKNSNVEFTKNKYK